VLIAVSRQLGHNPHGRVVDLNRPVSSAQERWGKDLSATRDYGEILGRADIYAVIIATPDHWHKQITVEALNAWKHVYREKPMLHFIEEGKAVIEAQQKSGKTFQVGSQYVSSLVYQKAPDLLKIGAIGEINLVEAGLDRNTAIGAWQYSIPPDASPSNIDWDRFPGSAPKRPFEPIRLFLWRNYVNYGTGFAGGPAIDRGCGVGLPRGRSGAAHECELLRVPGVRVGPGRDAEDVVPSPQRGGFLASR